MNYRGKTVFLLAALGATTIGTSVASADSLIGLEDIGTSQQLHFFDSSSPNTPDRTISVTGLGENEGLLGIDYRPATSELYGLGTESRLYTIDQTTGVASQVGDGFTDELMGSSFGFDFNPVLDAIRIVSNTDMNYVANANTGDANVADTTPVFYAEGDPNEGADPFVINHAYTNAVANPDSTQLYAIDTNLDILATQANNAGTLETVGDLNFNLQDFGGFDINGETGTAFVAGITMEDVASSLFTLDLSTGALTRIGEIGQGGVVISGLTSIPDANVIPSPAALPAGIAMLAAVAMRRRRKLYS